jgi:hypothetical protein
MGGYSFGAGLPTWNGIPMINTGIPPFTGKYFYVKPYTGSDGNPGRSPDKPFKTLTKALDAATENKGDTVFLVQETNTAGTTTDYQSVALDWDKDGVNLIGIGPGPMMGHRSRIAALSTSLAIADLFTVSANNCLISNLEIYYGVAGATSAATRAMVVSGMRNRISNCQISGIGHLDQDDAAARSLTVTGAENLFQHCYVGLDTVLRTNALGEMEIQAAGNRNIFEDCIINSMCGATTFKAVLMNTVGSSAHSATWFKNTMFCACQNRTGCLVPTGAIIFAYAGAVFINGGGAFGFTDMSTADNANVYVLSHSGLAADIVDAGVARGVDIAA